MHREAYPIDPTLMSIFKLFTIVRIIYQAVLIALRLQLLENPDLVLPLGYLAIFCVMFLYLQSKFLRERLGAYFLPIPLIAATLVLVMERPLYNWYVATMVASATFRSGGIVGQLMASLPDSVRSLVASDVGWNPMLFVPLVLIAWQYRFRYTVYFVVTVVVMQLGVYPLIFGGNSPELNDFGLTLAGRLLAYLIVGYVVTRLAQALRDERNALHLANLQLQDHVAALDQLATSRERNRLARELHDTMAHSLSATAVQLEATQALWDTNSERAKMLLQEALTTTRSGLTETRRALTALRASPLEDLGLLLALKQLAQTSTERGGWELELKFPASLNQLPFTVEQTVYRAAQEALANSIKHASARHLCLELSQRERLIEFVIRDDGVGFDMKAVDQAVHLGLLGLRERVEILGGQVLIDSQPGQGTSMKLSIGY